MYLAVDAGGTKTEYLLADEHRVLARSTGDTLKLMNIGEAEATARLQHELDKLASSAGVPLYLVTRACMGLAGISSEGVRSWAQKTLGDLLTGELLLLGDEEIALEAAFGQGPGVLAIAGTGSHVIGRCSRGSRYTAGGWGPILGDEGAGHWIGLEGLRAGLRAQDRGVPSTLLRELNAAWELSGIAALIAKANGQPRPDFALLAEPVARCAAHGDALARSVLERAGEELAAQIGNVLSKMRAASCAMGDIGRIAFTGSVLGKIALVHQSMVRALQLAYPEVLVDAAPVAPIEGALARARRG